MSRVALIATLLAAAVANPARADTVAIVHARIQTAGPQDEIPSGTVVMRDGRIVAVGADVAVPSGSTIVEAKGRTVTPGMVMAGTPLSVVDLPTYGILDDQGTGSSKVSAAYELRYAVNPDDPNIADARAEGVTAALVTPGNAGEAGRPAVFDGQAVTISTADARDIVLQPTSAMLLDFGASGAGQVGGGRGTVITLLRAGLAEARRPVGTVATRSDTPLSAADVAALRPVAAGTLPLIVRVDRASDISTLLDVAREEKVRLVLLGAAEGWIVAREIAAAGVSVIVDPEVNIPASRDALHATYANAARLAAAGVRIAFTAVHARPGYLIRSPRVAVGRLVGRTGLSHGRAIRALTRDAAAIAGVGDALGSLEAGKRATMVLWSGDPLEATSIPDRVWIDGREQPLATRSRLLGERYLERYRAAGVLPR